MRRIVADLHVHSALSPCADDSMTPCALVIAAIAAELDLIAVCDHNSAENTAAVQEAARDFAGDLFGVIAGMEITTSEEAHVIALFPDAEHAARASQEVAAHLPPALPGTSQYARQYVMNAVGEILREADTMLSWASDLTMNQTVALIHKYNGLAIAAHVDRPSFSVVSQLGFLPEDVVFDALEISAAGIKNEKDADYFHTDLPIITGSDAHFLDNIGDGKTYFQLEMPTFSGVALALKGAAKRNFCRA